MVYFLFFYLLINSYFCFIIGDRKLLSPCFLINLMLLISTTIYVFCFSFFDHDISLSTFLVISIGLLAFELGELLSGYMVKLYRNYNDYHITTNQLVIVPNLFYYSSLVFLFIVTIMNYNYFMSIGEALGGAKNVFAAYAIARVYYNNEANLENTESFDRSSYLTIADFIASSIAYLFLYYYFYNKIICEKKVYKYLYPIIIYSPAFFFSTGRMSFATFLILCFVIFAFLLYHKFKSHKVNRYILKVGVAVFIISVILFKATGVIRGGAFLEDSKSMETSSTLEDLAVYVASPIYGLDYYVNECYNSDDRFGKLVGQNTLSGIYQLLRLSGFDIPDYPKHQKFFHWKNGSSNVYTGFKSDIQDYSMVGAPIYILFLGFICGFLYRYGLCYTNLRNSGTLFIVLGKLYYPIVFYFYVDDFYSLTNVDFIVLLFFLFLFNKLFLKSDEGNTYLPKSFSRTPRVE